MMANLATISTIAFNIMAIIGLVIVAVMQLNKKRIRKQRQKLRIKQKIEIVGKIIIPTIALIISVVFSLTTVIPAFNNQVKMEELKQFFELEQLVTEARILAYEALPVVEPTQFPITLASASEEWKAADSALTCYIARLEQIMHFISTKDYIKEYLDEQRAGEMPDGNYWLAIEELYDEVVNRDSNYYAAMWVSASDMKWVLFESASAVNRPDYPWEDYEGARLLLGRGEPKYGK